MSPVNTAGSPEWAWARATFQISTSFMHNPRARTIRPDQHGKFEIKLNLSLNDFIHQLSPEPDAGVFRFFYLPGLKA